MRQRKPKDELIILYIGLLSHRALAVLQGGKCVCGGGGEGCDGAKENQSMNPCFLIEHSSRLVSNLLYSVTHLHLIFTYVFFFASPI